jgi:hypothetical protein
LGKLDYDLFLFDEMENFTSGCTFHEMLDCEKMVAFYLAQYFIKSKKGKEVLDDALKEFGSLEAFNKLFGCLENDDLFYNEIAFKRVGSKYAMRLRTKNGRILEIPVFTNTFRSA